jgi:chorismate mutase
MKRMTVVAVVIIAALPLSVGQTADQKAKSSQQALVEHRKEIDAIDKQITSLLNKRAAIALEIGRSRQRDGTPPSSAQGRAEEVVRNAMARSVAPLNPEAMKRIYERIIAENRSDDLFPRAGAGNHAQSHCGAVLNARSL